MINLKERKKKKKVKIIWWGFIFRLIIILLLAMMAFGGYFIYKFYNLEGQIFQNADVKESPISNQEKSTLFETAKNIITNEKVELRGESRKRINILLLGMGGEGHKGQYLTDTIILVSINPETYQTAFLSIPRDLYVNIPETQIYTKINAVYTYELRHQEKTSSYSLGKLRETIKNITGQEVDYYIALDFEGFEKIINELGGVDVEVEDDIFDNRYPGPNYSYQTFEIKKGFHHLDGETALKYARVRHTAGGDFGRARRQQQILVAVKKKAFLLDNFINPSRLNNLINLLGEHLKMDIHFNEIPTFLKLAENINVYQATNKVLDAWSQESLLASSHVPLGGVMAYILIPRARNYSQIHELVENIFDLTMIERKNKEIENEKAKIIVFSDNYPKLYNITKVFEQWGYVVGIKQNENILAQCQKDPIIFNNGQEPKLFTLSDLGGKLKAGIVEEKFSDYEADVLVCLSKEASEYLAGQLYNKSDEDEKLKEQSVIDEEGNVLYNKN